MRDGDEVSRAYYPVGLVAVVVRLGVGARGVKGEAGGGAVCSKQVHLFRTLLKEPRATAVRALFIYLVWAHEIFHAAEAFLLSDANCVPTRDKKETTCRLHHLEN